MTKDFFSMTRRERRGTIVVLVAVIDNKTQAKASKSRKEKAWHTPQEATASTSTQVAI